MSTGTVEAMEAPQLVDVVTQGNGDLNQMRQILRKMSRRHLVNMIMRSLTAATEEG